ncbi:maleylpyruvate isomerase family mycothiol-dependent enzyme, partial [Streptomyces sp. NPDC006129]|uniref:maleylpyruvate isomerase family mycothiol-dependent enzyme n=1 Tax=Streptomyces sp. NPDC006129 TaxID=3155348 RepID=UPI0033A2928E
METAELLRVLETEGRLLATAAEEAGTDAKVPTCPGWQVRDLLLHMGTVHRWAASYVTEGHTERRLLDEPTGLDGAELLAWYRDGHSRLIGVLAGASPDVECWTFLPAPSPLAFWIRRQAHETTVHRVDAESARGGGTTAVAADFATDGIDELLRGFHARPQRRVR